jgi:hypothetical protein
MSAKPNHPHLRLVIPRSPDDQLRVLMLRQVDAWRSYLDAVDAEPVTIDPVPVTSDPLRSICNPFANLAVDVQQIVHTATLNHE